MLKFDYLGIIIIILSILTKTATTTTKNLSFSLREKWKKGIPRQTFSSSFYWQKILEAIKRGSLEHGT